MLVIVILCTYANMVPTLKITTTTTSISSPSPRGACFVN